MHCIFCNDILEENILYQTEYFKLVWDIDPIQTGHLLIISKEHFTSLAELPLPVLHELAEVEQTITRLLEQTLPIDGVTLARNDKDLMDQGTHFHSHLIPRKKDDCFWEQIVISQHPLPLEAFLKHLKHN